MSAIHLFSIILKSFTIALVMHLARVLASVKVPDTWSLRLQKVPHTNEHLFNC